MLGHLFQSISKRFSTADQRHPRTIPERHYKFCCCDQRHDDILRKSGRACQVYMWSYRHDNYTFIVDISLCKSCICMHVFYTIIIDKCSHNICRTFCFQVTFVQSFEFRIFQLTTFNTSKFEIFSLQNHVNHFHCCQPIKSYQVTESNHTELLTNHVQDAGLQIEEHTSIGHCFCEIQNDTVLLTHGWCKGAARTLKCYWLNFSTLAYLLLFENIHRNFRKNSSCLSVFPGACIQF